jgi:hypothetical protein
MTIATSTGVKKGSNRKKYIAGICFVAGIVVACVLLVYHWEYVLRFQKYGYLGLFLMSLVSGFSTPMPVPYMIFTFTLGGVLHPALVGIATGAGLGAGGTLLYLTGRGGRRIFPHFEISDPADEVYSSRCSRFLRRIKMHRIMHFAHRRGALAQIAAIGNTNSFDRLPGPAGKGKLGQSEAHCPHTDCHRCEKGVGQYG